MNHRVVAILGPPPSASAAPSLLARAEPALARWLASLLPPPATITIAVELGAGDRWEGTAATLGLGAVELVALTAVGGELASSLLGAMVAARARVERTVTSGILATISGGLTDVAVAAGALRALVGASRPLRGDDLATTAGLPHVIDVAELDARRVDLAEALDQIGSAEPSSELLLIRFADLAAIDPAGLVAALSAAHDVALVTKLLRAASDRAKALLRPFPTGWETLAPDAQAEHLSGRIAAALGVAIPVLARHKPANATQLNASLAASPRRVGSQQAAMSWLLAAGRVHDGTGRCAEALDLAEVVHPAAAVSFHVAQLPHIEGEPWVAVDGLSSPGGRLNILCVTDAAAAIAQGSVAGLIFDAWSEPIPGRRATTGVAVHFDRPGAQPPQAVLLGMPPEEGNWTVEHLESLLLETLDLAAVRAVGPETLARLGHTLPAVTLADGAAVAVVPDASSAPEIIGVDVDDLLDTLDDLLDGPDGIGPRRR